MTDPPRSTADPRFATWCHRRIVFPALDFVLASRCFVCGRRLGRHQHLGACLACWTRLAPPGGPVCRGCGLSAPRCTDVVGPARGRCARCVAARGAVDEVVVAVEYDDLARRFLLRAKLGRRPELLDPLGRQLSAALRRRLPDSRGLVVVAVPSHPLRDLARGFSPAGVLARRVSRELGLEVARRTLRRRLKSAGSVKRFGARRRRSAVESAFFVGCASGVTRVLLVDDVMTSGATVEACARVLRAAGAVEVRVAVWARTPADEVRGGMGAPGACEI